MQVEGCAMCAQGFCVAHYYVGPITSCASVSPPEQGVYGFRRRLFEKDEPVALRVPSETWEQEHLLA